MSTSCYYFCSQLPHLFFDAPPPFTLETFDRQAAALLSEQDAARVCGAEFPVVREGTPTGLYAAYRAWDFALTGEIARYRLAAAKSTDTPDGMPPETGSDLLLERAVGTIAEAPDPMERERRIDAMRWRKIEELAAGREFTLDALAAYRLKLALINKHHHYTTESGELNIKAAIKAIDAESAE